MRSDATLCSLHARRGRHLVPRSPQPTYAPIPNPSPPQPANALTYDEIQSLTYKQVKGTGVANTCAVLQSGTSNLSELTPGAYKLERFCMEPTSFTVREESQFRGGESEFVNTRLLTRLTYTLDAVSTGPCAWLFWGCVSCNRSGRCCRAGRSGVWGVQH